MIYLYIIIGVILTIWIAFFLSLLEKQEKIIMGRKKIKKLLEKRLNSIPLLINLMTPFLVKKEEVLQKCLELRQELLYKQDMEKEQQLSRQITFLLSVAEKHEEVATDTRFIQMKQEIEQWHQQINMFIQEQNKRIEKMISFKKKIRWFLFPSTLIGKNIQSLSLLP